MLYFCIKKGLISTATEPQKTILKMAKEQKKKQAAPAKASEPKKTLSIFPLDKINFVMIGVCLLLIVLGFLLMAGSSNTGDTFNNDIFSTRRTVIGPLVALLGFVLMVPAIMYKPKGEKKTEEKPEESEETTVKE